MSTTTPNQGIVIPVGTDPADNPDAFVDMIAGVENRLIQRYTSTADRTARNPTPATNEMSIIDGTTWYERYTGTKWMPCTPISVVKTANQIVNNSTVLVNDAMLLVPLPAASTYYELSALVRYTSSVAADIKFAFTVPAGTTGYIGGPGMTTAAAGQTATSDWEAVTIPAVRPYGGAGGATFTLTKVRAIVLTAATTGNARLQWAQNTADATNTTVFAFSSLKAVALQ